MTCMAEMRMSSFLGMWTAMMVPMMLPSLVPMLRRYRQAGGGAGPTAIASLGYFFVWTAIGVAAFPLSVALARATPLAIAVIVLIAGSLQFTEWKARRLACCHEEPARGRAAWQHGLRLGLRCASCCGNLMAILLVLGMMDLRVMAAVTAAITAERLAPAGERVARAIGVVVAGVGVVLIARAG